jgi:class 3 adenylate cyclase/HAMP domain-containing protein/ActR/RegA family two-component response regulator
MAPLRILLIQSDMQTAQPLARFFTHREDEIWQAWELGQAFALIDQVKPTIIFMDLHYASSEWLNFIRRVRRTYPYIRIAMTNKYPDLQREMLVREQNVQVFLRQPFSPRWIEQALSKLTEETQPVRAQKTTRGKKKRQSPLPKVRPVRIPLWVKMVLPYLVLALVLGLSGAILVNRLLLETTQAGLLDQLARATPATRTGMLVLIIVCLLLLLGIGLYLSIRISRTAMQLAAASMRVADGSWEVKIDAGGDDEVSVLAQSFNYMVAGLQEGSIYRDLLGRAVTQESREALRQTLSSGSLRMEGQQAPATLMMVEIRGFPSLTEKVDAGTVFQWLNEYTAQIAPSVIAHSGVVGRFDGQVMQVSFGILPRLLSPKQSATSACQAAVEIVQAVDRLNLQRRRRGEPQLMTSIAINSGTVAAGGLGSADRLHYAVIGDAVNVTQRISDLAGDLLDKSGVLVGQATYAALGSAVQRFCLQPMDGQPLGEQPAPKDSSETVQVYRLTGMVEQEVGREPGQ